MLSQQKLIEKIAQEAVAYARNIIPNCAIEPQDSPNEPEEKKKFIAKVREKYNLLEIQRDKLINLDPHDLRLESHSLLPLVDTTLQFIRESSDEILGNCGELAFLAIEYIANRNKVCSPEERIRGELFTIKNGNHDFVVMNRKEDSDPEKPEEWGEECYICDPWTREYYLAKDYKNRLKSLETATDDQKNIDTIRIIKPSSYNLKCEDLNTTLFEEKETPLYKNKIIAKYKASLTEIKNLLKRDDAFLGFLWLEDKISDQQFNELNIFKKFHQDLKNLEEQAIPENLQYIKLMQLLGGNLKSITPILNFITEKMVPLRISLTIPTKNRPLFIEEKEIPAATVSMPAKISVQPPSKPTPSFKEKLYTLFCCVGKKPIEPQGVASPVSKKMIKKL